jgi:hypothetical protein
LDGRPAFRTSPLVVRVDSCGQPKTNFPFIKHFLKQNAKFHLEIEDESSAFVESLVGADNQFEI